MFKKDLLSLRWSHTKRSRRELINNLMPAGSLKLECRDGVGFFFFFFPTWWPDFSNEAKDITEGASNNGQIMCQAVYNRHQDKLLRQ